MNGHHANNNEDQVKKEFEQIVRMALIEEDPNATVKLTCLIVSSLFSIANSLRRMEPQQQGTLFAHTQPFNSNPV